MSTNPIPLLAGIRAKNFLNASTPPADAPIATIGKSAASCCARRRGTAVAARDAAALRRPDVALLGALDAVEFFRLWAPSERIVEDFVVVMPARRCLSFRVMTRLGDWFQALW